MFFLCFRTPPPLAPPPSADFCSRDIFLTTFGVSFIVGTIVGPDLWITWLDFGRFSLWPWPWIFKVKHGICYISSRNGPIATKQKANILIELKALNVTMGFDLGHDLDLDFSRSNMEFAISQSKVIRRSGVRIYKIMTGVTFDVGVPSTHLVQFVFILTPLTRGSSPLCLIRGFKHSREQPDFPSTHW